MNWLMYWRVMSITGTSSVLPGMVAALRQLAQSFPNATFVPGHGPLAHAADLRDYADYLEDLERQVSQAHAAGRSEDEAVRSVDLRRWHRRILPSFPDDRLIPEWATAARNVRSAYALIAGGGPVAGGVQRSAARVATHPGDRS
jgi:hypothetical protein